MHNYNETAGELWDWIAEYGIATDEEIQLVSDICGNTVETMNNIIYARTGCRDKRQYEIEYLIDEDE